MADQKKRISELTESMDTDGLYTIGVNKMNESVKVPLGKIVANELALGAVYDVSAKNPTAGPNNNGKFESLSALLSDNNLDTLIPASVRKGGMSIKYVQNSDNKYVQDRCMAQNFTTDVTQWQGVDDEPTAGSENLVKSGGVAESENKIISNFEKILSGSGTNDYTTYEYMLYKGVTYTIENTHTGGYITARAVNDAGQSMADICNNLTAGNSVDFVAPSNYPKIKIIGTGKFKIYPKYGIDIEQEAQNDAIRDAISGNASNAKNIVLLENEIQKIEGHDYSSELIANRGIQCMMAVGEVNNNSSGSMPGWEYLKIGVTAGQVFSLTLRGGTNYPAYFILDSNNIVLAKDTVTTVQSIELTMPQEAAWLVINNQMSAVDAVVVRQGDIISINKKIQEIEAHDYSDSIISGGRGVPCTGEIGEVSNVIDAALSGWGYIKLNVNRGETYHLKVRGNIHNPAYFVVDSSNVVLLKSTTTIPIECDVCIPEGGTLLIVNNYFAQVANPVVKRLSINNAVGFVNEKIESTKCIETDCTKYLKYNYNTAYIQADGGLHESNNWRVWSLPVGVELNLKCFNNDIANIKNIGFYSGIPSSSTFISGISASAVNTLSDIHIDKSDIPTGTKVILFASRVASGVGSCAIYNKVEYKNLNSTVEALKLGKPNIEAIYRGLPNTNDFCIIKDEMWFAENIYEGGVATETTIITRYKFVGEEIVYKGRLTTDFGHWNTVDYNPHNDCLLFTNSANEATTEGNYFTVIKNPLALSGNVSKDNVGLKYNVDLGFKINAVWGNGNLGMNNIIYILSNNAANFTKVLLSVNSSGEFNGNYVVLEQRTTGRTIGINGMALWNNIIYIGMTNRSIALLDLYDFSFTVLQEKYYRENGDEITGSTQGIVVDSEHIWKFINVTGKLENYLIKCNR